jgi:hypothetical protein
MSAEGSVDAARSPLSAMMEASAGLDAATNRCKIYTTQQHGGSQQPREQKERFNRLPAPG